jgi:CarD family transcriptional regulator
MKGSHASGAKHGRAAPAAQQGAASGTARPSELRSRSAAPKHAVKPASPAARPPGAGTAKATTSSPKSASVRRPAPIKNGKRVTTNEIDETAPAAAKPQPKAPKSEHAEARPAKAVAAKSAAAVRTAAGTADPATPDAAADALGDAPGDASEHALGDATEAGLPEPDPAEMLLDADDTALDDTALDETGIGTEIDAEADEEPDEAELPAAAARAAEAPARPAGGSPRQGFGQGPMPPRQPVRTPSKQEDFTEGDHVVYPTHGVGKVERIATEEIAGHKLELIHITFEENRMTLRVPVMKARSAGLRKLATPEMFKRALDVLKGRARIKRTMWSRRAQEYEAKINSGDPLAIAEVVRDLHRNAGQPDQSFSERQIYEAAMDRLAAELAALDKTDKATASAKLVDFLKTV